ncbi:23787_t:CDS:2, partial [Gigaspora margarita]
MFQGLSIKSKKTSKNTQSKKANKEKTVSLESTRSTSLNESFSERFDNLEVNDNSRSNSYSNAKMSESYERILARIIENQEEILSELKVIKDKVRRIENHLNDLEQKMNNGFNITNDKAFKEDTIKEAAKTLIEKAIYPKNSQI